ncbi:hypothetical protein GCM10009127_18470 [Alteraurantiacibacter aestuarii]|uniref:hypothetical protein n=1 Tax=Alteraurantiacibacter aestuarii TaxID=650004 RepID=UPI0031CF178C
MEEERIARALARIEAAANRIEAAASRPIAPPADPELVNRHASLRREAWAALAELDGLIETLEA